MEVVVEVAVLGPDFSNQYWLIKVTMTSAGIISALGR